jgi:hypothetical protein
MKLDRYKTHDIETLLIEWLQRPLQIMKKRLSENTRHASWRKCTNDIRSRFERGALL